MPTVGYRPEWTAEDRNEGSRPRGRDGVESLADCPAGYRPPSAQECQIPDMQKWIDLCA